MGGYLMHSMNAVQASPPLVTQADLKIWAAAHGVDEAAGIAAKSMVGAPQSSKKVSEIATLPPMLMTTARIKAIASCLIAFLLRAVIPQKSSEAGNV